MTTTPSSIFPLRTPLTNHHIRPPSPMVSRSAPSSQANIRQPSPSSTLRQPSPSQMRQPSNSLTNFSASLRHPSPVSLRPPSPAKRDLLVRPFGHDFLVPKSRPNSLAGQIRRAPSPMTAALQGPLRPLSAPSWRPR
jgi:hypothetical protein